MKQGLLKKNLIFLRLHYSFDSMKIKVLCTLFFLMLQFGYSQQINGKVVVDNYPVPNVEIVNATTKVIAVSDSQGEFSIAAKYNDEMLFISRNHETKKVVINPLLFINNVLVIDLVLKAEELREVKITTMPSVKISADGAWEQQKIDGYDIENNAVKPVVQGVYTGDIKNGPNFVRIAGMIASLFIKDKEPRQQEKEIVAFKSFADQNCKEEYYIKTLGLKAEHVELFKEFCAADPVSVTIVSANNKLRLMDFLLEKSIAFKKL